MRKPGLRTCSFRGGCRVGEEGVVGEMSVSCVLVQDVPIVEVGAGSASSKDEDC